MTYWERRRAKNAIRKCALGQASSEADTRRDMEAAIRQGFENAQQAGDQTALDLWKTIPCKGELPTPEEFIVWVAEQASLLASTEQFGKKSE